MFTRTAVVLLPLVLFLAACEYGSSYSEEGPTPYNYPRTITTFATGYQERAYVKPVSYSREEFQFPHEPEDMKVEVMGNPFAVEKAAFDSIVIERMQPAEWVAHAVRPLITFTPEPGSNTRHEYRVLAVFDEAPGQHPSAYCAGAPVDFAPLSDVIRLRVMLCREDKVIAMTVSALNRVDNPMRQRFQRRVSAMTRGLFPLRDLRGPTFESDVPPFSLLHRHLH
jgi:hypothetical protein